MQANRVLIATPLYPPEIGGPASYTRALEVGLPKHDIEVDVCKFSDVKQHPFFLRHLMYFFKVHDRANDTDIVYAQDPLGVGLPALIAARFLRKPFFLKIVGDRAWEEEQRQNPSMVDLLDFQTRKYGIATELRRKLERFVANYAERIIVPSEYLRSVVLMWGVEPARVFVVQNGLPPLEFPAKATAKEKLNIQEPLIVSIGRLSPWKGFPAVINAMSRLRARNISAKLVIVGSGTVEERAYLESEIVKHHLEGAVLLAGAVSREEVMTYLAASDIFVLNTFYEGFSHQIIEAMLSGTAIVTTNAGGNAEVLEDGKDCQIIPYNHDMAISHAFIDLLADPAKREALGQHAKQKAAAYTEARMIEELIPLLK